MIQEIEAEDGYLTDEWLDALRGHEFDPEGARLFLIETFPDACCAMSCCRCESEDIKDRYFDAPAKLIKFSTGGWSGAEDLIDIMLGHFWIRHFYTRWERGGHYEFEVRA